MYRLHCVLKLNMLFNLFVAVIEIFDSDRNTFIICKRQFWCEHPWSETKKNEYTIYIYGSTREKLMTYKFPTNKQFRHFVCMRYRMNLLSNQCVHCAWAVLTKIKLKFQQCLQMKYIWNTIFRRQSQVINYNKYRGEAFTLVINRSKSITKRLFCCSSCLIYLSFEIVNNNSNLNVQPIRGTCKTNQNWWLLICVIWPWEFIIEPWIITIGWFKHCSNDDCSPISISVRCTHFARTILRCEKFPMK